MQFNGFENGFSLLLANGNTFLHCSATTLPYSKLSFAFKGILNYMKKDLRMLTAGWSSLLQKIILFSDI